ncbi:hypothetical protein O1L60_25275 [Streptomyces diastatochromogenes]|nr:hypothetical protein [Streptomyces diastatochromogenes]
MPVCLARRQISRNACPWHLSNWPGASEGRGSRNRCARSRSQTARPWTAQQSKASTTTVPKD